MNFENRLLDALTEVDAARPAAAPVARPRAWRPALVAAGAVAVVLAGAMAVSTLVGNPASDRVAPNQGSPDSAVPVAFVVRTDSDGSVVFSASDVVDPVAATAALNQAGISGRVVNNTNGCGPIDPADLSPGFPSGPHSRPRPTDTGPPAGIVYGENTVTVRTSDYAPGGGVLVVVQLRERPSGPWAAVLFWSYADVNAIPTCVDVTDPGTD